MREGERVRKRQAEETENRKHVSHIQSRERERGAHTDTNLHRFDIGRLGALGHAHEGCIPHGTTAPLARAVPQHELCVPDREV